ncbi:MAG: [FeFe] hydrogenase, group A [Candidatus Aenigmarchaeota archaeon]|nr:[FeFe] hydrogenase, group A [Candidatus Aenigmarchaeota archaeon]
MQVKLNGKRVSFREGETILELTKRKGIEIPTLCYHPSFEPESRCRLCVVEIDGKLVTSCDTKIRNSMDILTDSKKVMKSRKIGKRLIEEREKRFKPVQDKNPVIIDHSKCILCGNCIKACNIIQNVHAIGEKGKGIETKVSAPFDLGLENSPCTFCGQCTHVCNCDAIRERDDSKKLMTTLKDKKKHVVVQTAPSIRASLGELFGMPHGSLVTGKMITAMRKVGFDMIFDTDFGADMTTYEETYEFLERLKNGGPFPMFTSCCPAWVRFVEYYYPGFIKNVSTAKPPIEMFGVVAKNFYAKNTGINPKNVVVVAVVPCTAKKFEIERPEMKNYGLKNVDITLTTREIGAILKKKKIDFKKLKESKFDNPLGESSGGGAIYGVTGGVLETILRAANCALGEKTIKIEFKSIRGLKGIREATVKIGGKNVKVAVAHGLSNIRKILELIKSGKKKYHFVEMMACPGGCIGGGGQPKSLDKDILKKRSSALYCQDRKLKIRIANNNPVLIEFYKEVVKKPLSKKAHELLHAEHKKRLLKF